MLASPLWLDTHPEFLGFDGCLRFVPGRVLGGGRTSWAHYQGQFQIASYIRRQPSPASRRLYIVPGTDGFCPNTFLRREGHLSGNSLTNLEPATRRLVS